MTTLSERFEIASASVTGAIHRRNGCGSQDAVCVSRLDAAIIAVISDGCGGAPSSELGAQLGVKLWARALEDSLLRAPGAGLLDLAGISRARRSVTVSLSQLVESMTSGASERVDIIRDCFLFTTIGAVVAPLTTTIFAIGDGFVGINDSWLCIEPFSENRPAYVAYDLIAELEHLAPITLFTTLPTTSLRSLVLATDGAEPLIEDESLGALIGSLDVFSNRDRLRRVLEPLAAPSLEVDWDRQRVVRKRQPLTDDTTVVAIRASSLALESKGAA